MAKDSPSYDHVKEDDYIDMDISSTTFLCYSKPSPPHSREFEFQKSFNPLERETTTSPADKLFYKGKLLPLHLPPRLQMVQMLLQNSTNSHVKDTDALGENLVTTTTATTTARSSLSESCKFSPASSCHVSGELSPEEYMHECPQPKKSWSKKLMLIKQSSLSLNLKASKAYIKSLFTNKPGCPEEVNAAPKARDCSSGYLKAEKNSSSSQLMADSSVTTLIGIIERDKLLEEECLHRKSFLGAINCHLTPRSSPAISSCSSSSSSSSFSSVNSNRFYGSQMLNRSSSVNSEVESSIQGAIVYCKKSQVTARKSVSDIEFCSLSASRIVTACENQEKPRLCRG